MTNACETNPSPSGLTFEAVLSELESDKYWISFFVRPCCPPPSPEDAAKSLEKLREEIRAQADYTDDQKQQLIEVIDAREKWYKASPFCRA